MEGGIGKVIICAAVNNLEINKVFGLDWSREYSAYIVTREIVRPIIVNISLYKGTEIGNENLSVVTFFNSFPNANDRFPRGSVVKNRNCDMEPPVSSLTGGPLGFSWECS